MLQVTPLSFSLAQNLTSTYMSWQLPEAGSQQALAHFLQHPVNAELPLCMQCPATRRGDLVIVGPLRAMPWRCAPLRKPKNNGILKISSPVENCCKLFQKARSMLNLRCMATLNNAKMQTTVLSGGHGQVVNDMCRPRMPLPCCHY